MSEPGSDFQKTNSSVEYVFDKLISTDKELYKYFTGYINSEYEGDTSNRLIYYDIARIGDYITQKLMEGNTEKFTSFFDMIEEILSKNDPPATNLIVVGLFENLQAHGDNKASFSKYDKWLKQVSVHHWNELIEFWNNTPQK